MLMYIYFANLVYTSMCACSISRWRARAVFKLEDGSSCSPRHPTTRSGTRAKWIDRLYWSVLPAFLKYRELACAFGVDQPERNSPRS